MIASAALDGLASVTSSEGVDRQYAADLKTVAARAVSCAKANKARHIKGPKTRADAKLRRF